MPKLCTGCGLTTDDDGNLIASTSGGTYEDTYKDCGTANGGKVYCSSGDGKLYVAPEPMYREWVFVDEIKGDGGELTVFGFSQKDDLPKDVSYTGTAHAIKNPSCRPMQLYIEVGVQHGLFTVDSGGPDANDFARGDIQADSYYSIAGALTATDQQGGHFHYGFTARGTNNERQIFRADSTGAYFDLPHNANGTGAYVLPAGASITVTPKGKLTVIRYTTTGDGSVRLENFRVAIRVRGWAGA